MDFIPGVFRYPNWVEGFQFRNGHLEYDPLASFPLFCFYTITQTWDNGCELTLWSQGLFFVVFLKVIFVVTDLQKTGTVKSSPK
jgi:hypothetical protein